MPTLSLTITNWSHQFVRTSLLLLFGCATSLDTTVSAIAKADSSVVSIGNATHTLASGFFITPQLVMTNEHVTQAGELYLVTAGGKRHVLVPRVKDVTKDVAIFRVKNYQSDNSLSFNSGPLAVGTPVIVIGNPFGAGITASAGIISALPRAIGKQHLLQTDAAINPGNSGGPLINLQGDVVGLVTSRGAVGSGIGFAVPVDQLRELIEQAKLIDKSDF